MHSINAREFLASLANPDLERTIVPLHSCDVSYVQIKTSSVSIDNSIVSYATEARDSRSEEAGWFLICIGWTEPDANEMHEKVVADIKTHFG